jgi:hypothetical protein
MGHHVKEQVPIEGFDGYPKIQSSPVEEENSSDEDIDNDPFHDEGLPTRDEEKAVAPSPPSGSDSGVIEDNHSGYYKKKNQCDEDYEDLKERMHNSKLQIISDVVFAFASAIYVALEVTILPYYQFYRDVPYHVRETDEEDVWWKYYNETGKFPDWLLNRTDDWTWEAWFNSSFMDEEEELGEFLFQVPNAEKKYEVSWQPRVS